MINKRTSGQLERCCFKNIKVGISVWLAGISRRQTAVGSSCSLALVPSFHNGLMVGAPGSITAFLIGFITPCMLYATYETYTPNSAVCET